MTAQEEIAILRAALTTLEQILTTTGRPAPLTHSILLLLPADARKQTALDNLKEALHDVADRAEYLAEL